MVNEERTIPPRSTIRFEKVSFQQFLEGIKDCFGYAIPDDVAREIYDNIKLPKRSTGGSAGYDIFSPFDMTVYPNSYQKIPTGIRFVTDDIRCVFLAIVPRSGLGFKYGSKLSNTIGIIDSDYYLSDNEGQIMVKMTGEKEFSVEQGKAICQGIIMPYLVVNDDHENGVRNGGFGSTGV